MSRRFTMSSRALMIVCLAAVVVMCGSAAFAQTNLAPYGTASASSTYSPAYAPDKSIDGDYASRWSAAVNDNQWFQVVWAEPQTFNVVKVHYFGGFHIENLLVVEAWNSAASAWVEVARVGDGVNVLPLVTTVSFPTVTTSRLRISNVITFTELEVFYTTLQGRVTNTAGMPVSGATVKAGGQTTATDGGGFYAMTLEPGAYMVTASRTYQYAKGTATVPADGIGTLDLQVESHNLAPLGTASASTEYPGYEASKGNDDNPGTAFSIASEAGDPDKWYQIDWDTEQTFNMVIVRWNPSYHVEQVVTLEAWDSATSDWTVIAVVGDEYSFLPMITNIAVAPVTTTKLRISQVVTLLELEVYESSMISGMVTDAATGFPVGCALVQGGFEDFVTTSDGFYFVEAPAGSLTLRAYAETFQDFEMPVTVPAEGLSQDIVLNKIPGNLASTITAITASSTHPASDAIYAVDGDACTDWTLAEGDIVGALILEWASAQTIDTVVAAGAALDLRVDAWKNGVWYPVGVAGSAAAPSAKLTVEFFPVETEKIRLRNLMGAVEVGVFNFKGAASPINVTGVVRNASTGLGTPGAVVAVDGIFAITNDDGEYMLAVPAGSYTATASKPSYTSASRGIVAPSSGAIAVDFTLVSRNLAPSAVATASSIVPGFEPELGNDDDWTSRYSKTPGETNPWYQLEWAEPVTFDRIKVHQLAHPSGAWGMRFLEVRYWDGDSWELAGRIDGLKPPLPEVVDMPIGATTTTRIRLFGIDTFWDVEVISASDAFVGNIGQIRDLADGTAVQVTGSVTAIFPDIGAGYVEATDRSSGIRVEPMAKLGYVVDMGDNFSLTGTADAQSYHSAPYLPEFAIDGNLGTRWSGSANYQWFDISWDTAKTINTVIVHQDGLYAYNLDITVQAWDESTGQFVSIANGGTNRPVNTITFEPVTTTRLRLTGVTTVWEIEARYVITDTSGVLTDKEVTIVGSLATKGKERVLMAGQVTAGADNPLGPLGLPGRSFIGENSKLTTIGLLTKTWGKVTRVTTLDDGRVNFYVNDGSNIPSDIAGIYGVKVGPVSSSALTGNTVQVTGIAGAFDASDGTTAITLRPRDAEDVIKYVNLGPNLSLSGTATAEDTFGGDPVTYAPQKGIDGNMGTRWSANGNYRWFQVEWASPQTLNTVVLKNLDEVWNRGQTATIQVWNESTEQFDEVASAVVDSGTVVFVFPDQVTTKVRVTNVTSFWELEIYRQQ